MFVMIMLSDTRISAAAHISVSGSPSIIAERITPKTGTMNLHIAMRDTGLYLRMMLQIV